MSFANWLDLVKSAEKTSVISGNARKIHYKFADGKEMAEEYSMETGVVVRRAWKRSRELMGEPEWELELGEPVKYPNENKTFTMRESSTEPVLTKRITKRNIEWRIRNLPYPIETYSVSASPEKNSLVVRTSNKKYFKNITVPELERCGLAPNQSCISINHQYNTLIITYKKPEILCEMEIAVLKELKNVETETDMDDLLKGLLGKETNQSNLKNVIENQLSVLPNNRVTAPTPTKALNYDDIIVHSNCENSSSSRSTLSSHAISLDHDYISIEHEKSPTTEKHNSNTTEIEYPLSKRPKYETNAEFVENYTIKEGDEIKHIHNNEIIIEDTETCERNNTCSDSPPENSTILSYLKRIESRLNGLNTKVNVLCRELRLIKQNNPERRMVEKPQSPPSSTQFSEILSYLPCQCDSSVMHLETEVTNNRETYLAVADYLKSFKETDHSKYVRKCLTAIFADEVTIVYNWTGKGERKRKAASSLQITRIINDAVNMRFVDVPLKSTEKIMMRWFRYGPQRIARSSESIRAYDDLKHCYEIIE